LEEARNCDRRRDAIKVSSVVGCEGIVSRAFDITYPVQSALFVHPRQALERQPLFWLPNGLLLRLFLLFLLDFAYFRSSSFHPLFRSRVLSSSSSWPGTRSLFTTASFFESLLLDFFFGDSSRRHRSRLLFRCFFLSFLDNAASSPQAA
jgi:hypothetical protein